MKLFLLTPLREGRRAGDHARLYRDIHFYSRPCGRGDSLRFIYAEIAGFISTHAPAGGATYVNDATPGIYSLISTHAPAGGATIAYKQGFRLIPEFLLTPLREGRRQFSTSPS